MCTYKENEMGANGNCKSLRKQLVPYITIQDIDLTSGILRLRGKQKTTSRLYEKIERIPEGFVSNYFMGNVNKSTW